MKYTTEKETTIIDSLGSTITLIRKVNGEDVNEVQKQYRIVIRVSTDNEERMQYEDFTKRIANLRKEGRLVIKDRDPSTIPYFGIEFPKTDSDGSRLAIKCWTEKARIN